MDLWVWIVIAVVVIAIVIAIVVWFISCHNQFIRLKNDVEEAFSTMDICMKKRYDLIPNVVETVKGYAKHEKETLSQVIAARNMAVNANNTQEKSQAEANLNSSVKALMAVAEQYPNLKADANFTSLQNQLSSLEVEIANSRRYYNACVKTFNNKVLMFPSNIVARKYKFEKQPSFEVDAPEERKTVKVEF